jgi:hypothetical protein
MRSGGRNEPEANKVAGSDTLPIDSLPKGLCESQETEFCDKFATNSKEASDDKRLEIIL